MPVNFVCSEAMEPRGSTPTEAPEAPASEAPILVYVAVYQYASTEAGDLSFEAGEKILVTKKESDWWTGEVLEDRSRTGVFPFNYVDLDMTAVRLIVAS